MKTYDAVLTAIRKQDADTATAMRLLATLPPSLRRSTPLGSGKQGPIAGYLTFGKRRHRRGWSSL